MSVLRKIIAIILIDRTIEKISKMIPPSQAAYRQGRGTTEQVFALKTLIEIARNSKEYEINILLMDMSKAFDRIDRSTLLGDLKQILDPQELRMFQILLTDTEIRIKIKNNLGKTIKTNIGSPQGDSASAILFILYLANRLKKYKIDVDKDDFFMDIQYADDLGWVTNREKYTINIKKNIPNTLKEGNLEINPAKTEFFESQTQRR